jgi:hypothetical protein
MVRLAGESKFAFSRARVTRCTAIAMNAVNASSIMKRQGAKRVRPGSDGCAPRQPKNTVKISVASTSAEVIGKFMARFK